VDNTRIEVIQDEARRLFGPKLTLESLPEPGQVYRVKPATSQGKPAAKRETTTKNRHNENVTARLTTVPPSLRGKRIERNDPVDQRSSEGRDITATGKDRAPGYGGCEITVIFPQKTQKIKNVQLSRHATKEEILELVFRQANIDRVHPNFVETAPENWWEDRHLTVRYRVDRPDLDSLERTTPERFRAEFNPTIPVFIETDGACSGNPGCGGWGRVVSQNGKKLEAFGSNADTTNNEMEFTAIGKALDFLPMVRAYVVIE
jgi:hypothetical protein